MRNLRLRAAGAAVVITMTMVIGQAFAPAIQASASGSQTSTFSGSVSQTGTRWVTWAFNVPVGGTITTQMNWTDTAADLNLFLKNPSGSVVGCDCSTSIPAQYSYTATVTGTWWIGVRAKTGASAYTATVTVPSGTSPSPSPSPTPSPTPPPTGQIEPADTSGHIGLFGQDWNTAPQGRTDAAWITAAQNNDLLVGTPGTYCKHIDQMHAANPSLVVLVYDLGPYTQRGTPLYNDILANHPNYFAHDSSGNLLTVQAKAGTPSFPNNTLMEPSQTGWAADEAQRVTDLINKCNFDGVYVDSMGAGPLTGTTTGVPVDPSTGQTYTSAALISALGRDMNVIKAAIGNKFLITSGLGNGISYQQFTHFLSDSNIDGIMTDSWIRLASNSPVTYPGTSLFQADLDMVQALQNQGKSFFGWAKVWNSSATQGDFTTCNQFALAAYLLVKGPHAYYSFSPALNADRTLVYDALEQANLGNALGPYTVSGGVYTRSFENGVVTVNPAAHTDSIIVFGAGG